MFIPYIWLELTKELVEFLEYLRSRYGITEEDFDRLLELIWGYGRECYMEGVEESESWGFETASV